MARPFKTPRFPVFPLLFIGSSSAMLASSLSYVTSQSGAGALVSAGVLGTGLIALVANRGAPESAGSGNYTELTPASTSLHGVLSVAIGGPRGVAMTDVFISYKQEERERMRPIANALIELGLDVWFDARLEPGKAFTQEIIEEIDSCRAMIVCWSPRAIASDYVRGEADIGRQRGVLVPVMIEPCRLVPPFNQLHAESLADWDGRPDHEGWRKVLRTLSRFFGRELGGAAPALLRQQATTPLLLPEMVRIPPGAFLMGSPESEPGSSDDERPQHEVRINDAFELGKYLVTFAEWDAARAAGADLQQPDVEGWARDRRPVVGVSRNDANAYIAWLNGKTSGGYRLPSEAEWEYACRAGTSSDYSTGVSITEKQAHFKSKLRGPTHFKSKSAVPVGSFPANAFGPHDMHGNVWEWVEDSWHDNYKGAPNDGSVWAAGGGDDSMFDLFSQSGGVIRGGGWHNDPDALRSAHRVWFTPHRGGSDIGFRLARSASGG